MDSSEGVAREKTTSRRKFVWVFGALTMATAVGTAVRFPFFAMKNAFAGKPASKKKTNTMLTQDGRLVEIDESLINSKKKKVTNYELLNWIKSNK